jgi:proteasome assembly chaperone 3
MFPPRAGQCACIIDGAHTEFLFTEYADRVLVIVTQIGKLGTVFQLSRRQSLELSDPSYDDDGEMMDEGMASMDAVVVRTVIGRRDDEALKACARRIADVLFTEGLEKYAARVEASARANAPMTPVARLTKARARSTLNADPSCARSGCGPTRA